VRAPHTDRYWSLLGLQIRAFARRGRAGCLARAALVVQSAVGLWAYERRVGAQGEAACILWPRWGRILGGGASLLVTCVILGQISTFLGAAVPSALLLALLPVSLELVRAGRERWRLKGIGPPPGRHVLVRSLASTRTGAGAELMRALTSEADEKGWSLLLDAADTRLVAYYERFGFVSCASTGRQRNRPGILRMWRPPKGPLARPEAPR